MLASERGARNFTDDDHFKFIGEPLKLNGTPIRVHADIDLTVALSLPLQIDSR